MPTNRHMFTLSNLFHSICSLSNGGLLWCSTSSSIHHLCRSFSVFLFLIIFDNESSSAVGLLQIFPFHSQQIPQSSTKDFQELGKQGKHIGTGKQVGSKAESPTESQYAIRNENPSGNPDSISQFRSKQSMMTGWRRRSRGSGNLGIHGGTTSAIGGHNRCGIVHHTPIHDNVPIQRIGGIHAVSFGGAI